MGNGKKEQTVAPKPQNTGKLISMGECIECHKEWFMYESEKKWWEVQGVNSGLAIPRRCEPCREEKRKRNMTMKSFSQQLRDIAIAIRDKNIAGKEEEYAATLHNIADVLKERSQRVIKRNAKVA